MSNWAFYNAVRAWVAQHPMPPPVDPEADPDDSDPWRSDMLAVDPPDTKR